MPLLGSPGPPYSVAPTSWPRARAGRARSSAGAGPRRGRQPAPAQPALIAQSPSTLGQQREHRGAEPPRRARATTPTIATRLPLRASTRPAGRYARQMSRLSPIEADLLTDLLRPTCGADARVVRGRRLAASLTLCRSCLASSTSNRRCSCWSSSRRSISAPSSSRAGGWPSAGIRTSRRPGASTSISATSRRSTRPPTSSSSWPRPRAADGSAATRSRCRRRPTRKAREEAGRRAYEAEQRARARGRGARQARPVRLARARTTRSCTATRAASPIPSGASARVTGIYFSGDEEDVQQWARVKFSVGIRTIPAGSLQFVDFSKPDPAADRVQRFMTAAQHALAEGDAALAAQRLIYARDADPRTRSCCGCSTSAFWQAGNLPAAARAVRDWAAGRDRPPHARSGSRPDLRGHGRDRPRRRGRRARGRPGARRRLRVGAAGPAAAAADGPRRRDHRARAGPAGGPDRRGPARPGAGLPPRRRRRRRGLGRRGGDPARPGVADARGRRYAHALARTDRHQRVHRGVPAGAGARHQPRSPSCSSASRPPSRGRCPSAPRPSPRRRLHGLPRPTRCPPWHLVHVGHAQTATVKADAPMHVARSGRLGDRALAPAHRAGLPAASGRPPHAGQFSTDSSTPSSSPTRHTSSRSSSTSIHTPADAGNTTWSPGSDRHRIPT